MGCGKTAPEEEERLQCPLCQAEGHDDRFFCSQTCFASAWLKHRDECHGGGVVREKKRKEEATDDEPQHADVKKAKKLKKKAAADESEAAEHHAESTKKKQASNPLSSKVLPWMPLFPSAAEPCAVTPPLMLSSSNGGALHATRIGTKTKVGGDASNRQSAWWWSAAAAAAQCIKQSSSRSGTATIAPLTVLVVAGSPLTANAFAWAARCAGLAGSLHMRINPHASPSSSAGETENGARLSALAGVEVVITTEAVALRKTEAELLPRRAEEGGAAPTCYLMALPDVEDAEAVQRVHMPLIHFLPLVSSAKATHHIQHELAEAAPWMVSSLLIFGGGSPVTDVHHWSVSDVVSTCLANGDMEGAALHIREGSYDAIMSDEEGIVLKKSNEEEESEEDGETSPAVLRMVTSESERLYTLLIHTMRCDWGALSVTHAHHRCMEWTLAVLRDISTGHRHRQVLLTAAVKALGFMVTRVLPPLTPGSSGASGSHSEEDLSLSAFMSLLLTLVLPSKPWPPRRLQELDAIATAWGGLSRVLDMTPAPRTANHSSSSYYTGGKNSDGVWLHRMLRQVAISWSERDVEYVKRLMLMLNIAMQEAEKEKALKLKEVKQQMGAPQALAASFFEHWEGRLLWKTSRLRRLLGGANRLQDVLTQLGFTTAAAGAASRKRSRDDPNKNTSSSTSLIPVLAIPYTWTAFPLATQAEEAREKLRRAAIEEILSAMPREVKPMYVGQVGERVGNWNHFNARYEGALGPRLVDFLSAYPRVWTVAGLLVTRRVAGTTEPVRIRFDDDDIDDDDSDDGRGGGATGRVVRGRTKRRNAVKEFNKSRQNRNYKPIDPSARVPGYTKRHISNAKGRGKKTNLREYKRGPSSGNKKP